MSTISPEFKEYTGAAFVGELESVAAATSVERDWMDRYEPEFFETDFEVLDAVEQGKLIDIRDCSAFMLRQFLSDWDISRSDPGHQWHYSPPFLKPHAAEFLTDLADDWIREMGDGRRFSVTSAVRSLSYQEGLAKRPGALTITEEGLLSSHCAGWSFDVDACGLFEQDDNGIWYPMNPRRPGFNSTLAAESRVVLRYALDNAKREGVINFVEELPGSTRHTFHVAVKPPDL